MNNKEESQSKPISTMKGKFYLKRIKNVLIFAVLDMNEKFRNKQSPYPISNTRKIFHSKTNGISIESSFCPLIGSSSNIFLRGTDKSRDNFHSAMTYKSETEAIKAKTDIQLALHEWSKNWVGWDNETLVDDSIGKADVFEV